MAGFGLVMMMMMILSALLCHPQTGLLSSSHALQTSVLANLLSNVTPKINITIVPVILVVEKINKCLQ